MQLELANRLRHRIGLADAMRTSGEISRRLASERNVRIFPDRNRLRIALLLDAAIPHISLSESEDNRVCRLVRAHRQVAIAENEPLFRLRDRHIHLQDMRCGD